MSDISSRRRWAGLVFISIAVALIIVDSTIVNVAIPSIVDDLGITSTQVQWVQEAYTLVFASLLLVFGSIADRFGRRRMLLIGVVIFTLASIGAAAAPTGEALILARFVQGVGGAMILPTTLSLLNATFRGRERGIAFAVWGSTIGGMAAVGPLLGGWLTTAFSWHWAFLINVPLGILIVVGVLLTVRESRGSAERVDVVGALLSIVTVGTLVFGLIEGRTYGWWKTDKKLTIGSWEWPFALSPIPIAFAIAVVGAIAFVTWGLHRRRLGRPTLLAFGLFRIPSFRNGNVAAMIVSLGEFGIILALPLWLQFVLGFDALQTGLILLSLAIGSFVASGFAGAFSGRFAPVSIVRVGILAEIVGIVGAARPRPVRLRVRRGARHGAADRGGARRCPRERRRPGIRNPVDGAPARSCARHRHPRHHPVLHDIDRAHGRPRRPGPAVRPARPDRLGRRRQRGRCDRRTRAVAPDACARRRRESRVLAGHPLRDLRGSRLPRRRPRRDVLARKRSPLAAPGRVRGHRGRGIPRLDLGESRVIRPRA
jgi:EmrB/QacA subfamily drug resistance transporter